MQRIFNFHETLKNVHVYVWDKETSIIAVIVKIFKMVFDMVWLIKWQFIYRDFYDCSNCEIVLQS